MSPEKDRTTQTTYLDVLDGQPPLIEVGYARVVEKLPDSPVAIVGGREARTREGCEAGHDVFGRECSREPEVLME